MDIPESKKPYWWDEIKALIAADPDWYAKYAAAEANRGNPFPLIGLVHGYPISNAEFRSITTALRATKSRETNAYLRLVEQKLIAFAVDRMVDKDKLKQTQAIAKVRKGRGRSTSHITAALRAHGTKRYHPR